MEALDFLGVVRLRVGEDVFVGLDLSCFCLFLDRVAQKFDRTSMTTCLLGLLLLFALDGTLRCATNTAHSVLIQIK